MYFENRNWSVERLKWLFSMVLCVNFNIWSWVYLLIVYDEVTFLWISLYCPQLLNILRSVEKYWCHFCKGFCILDRCSFCLTIFLVRESTLIFQRSCLFQSLIVEIKSERCQYFFFFEIQASLVKNPTRVIQYMQSFDYLVFWK